MKPYTEPLPEFPQEILPQGEGHAVFFAEPGNDDPKRYWMLWVEFSDPLDGVPDDDGLVLRWMYCFDSLTQDVSDAVGKGARVDVFECDTLPRP